MGNWLSVVEPPPQLPPPPVSVDESPPSPSSPVIKPQPVDFPPLASHTRMLESSYNLIFGKLALRSLFEDYFEEASRFKTRIIMPDDPHVDMISTFSCPLHRMPEEENVIGNAHFRWKTDNVDDPPHTFVDLIFSNEKPNFLLRSSAYFPDYGIGAFGISPLQRGISSGDYGFMGLRYDSSNVSLGATGIPSFGRDEIIKNAWVVGNFGRFVVGLQYEPKFGKTDGARYKNAENWSCAIGYGSGNPLGESFNFVLEIARDSRLIGSFYQRMRIGAEKQVKSPLEEVEGIGCIDFGFELQTSVDNNESSSNKLDESSFQWGASWQASENVLVKGKTGLLSSSLALTFKSWWKPSSLLNISAVRDHTKAETAFGFGICIDNNHLGY